MKGLSSRVTSTPPSLMLSLAEKIRQIEASGGKVIDFSLGQPEVRAPAHVVEAMRSSILSALTTYSASAGSRELRNLLALNLHSRSGATAEENEILVTAGSKHALFITLLSLLDPADEVVVFEPYFPPYAEIVALLGGAVKSVPILSPSHGELKPDVDGLLSAIGPRTKAVLLNYPNNPAGWTLAKAEVKRVVDYCSEKGVYVVSDEIYDHIVYDSKTHCPAWSFSESSDCVIHIGSFSKTYSMVPYRLGFVAARKRVIEGILKAQRATVTMVSPYVQSAGIAALKGPQDFVKSRLDKYTGRRNRCIEILSRHEVICPRPSGAFYLFIPLPPSSYRRWRDAFEFATKLLQERKLAVLPGGIFGERWSNYVRVSFATDDDILYPGLEELCEFLHG